MKYSFGKFNKEKIFDIDTSDFDYVSLEDLYSRDGEGAVYRIRGLYIGTKSNFDPEVPILATETEYVNIPVHQLDEIKAMLADKQTVKAINEGDCAFVIETYHQKRFNKDCYAAKWVDYAEAIANAAE